jgi:hypothetical protein
MLRQPKVFLAGCTSAEPASASFWYIKTTIKSIQKRIFTKKSNQKNVHNDKEKKKQKKKKMEWAIAHESFMS